MQDFASSFGDAFGLLLALDANLIEVVLLSLKVSLTAVAISALIGFPLGALLAVTRFPGRMALIVCLSAAMGLPPVVVGLGAYMLMSNAGPLGVLQLLYTPAAMIVVQAVLVTPIIAALARQTVEDLNEEYRDQLRLFGFGPVARLLTLIREGRYALLTILLAGFGRAIAEVGAVIIVGGNINHFTRVMTTAIALETSKGNLALALGLGTILIALAVAVNGSAFLLRAAAERASYA